MRITTLLAATLCVLPHQVLARWLVEPDEAARAADADAHVEAGKNAAVSTLRAVTTTSPSVDTAAFLPASTCASASAARAASSGSTSHRART